MKKKNLIVKCPKCKKKFKYHDSEFRPFCTEKCKMIDMGNWFNESYTIKSTEPLSDEDIEVVLKNDQGNNEE